MPDAAGEILAQLPPALAPIVEAKLAQARSERVGERVREGDATLWGPSGTPELADRLGWLTIAERMLGEIGGLEAFAAEVRAAGVRDVVLLGMGGSSLAAEVMRRSFGARPSAPALHVLDSTDAATVLAVQRAIDPLRSLFLVSSKSGGTVEPLSMLAHFWALVEDGASFVAITDPDSGLEALARERGFRRVFYGDPEIGGRYSALSAFGLVPAALAGLDVRELLQGAAGAWETPVSGQASAELPGPVWLGVALAALAQAGRDKLTCLVSGPLESFGLWLEQLVAESTGKQGTGILPVAEEPLGAPAAYGADRVFLHLPDAAAPDATLAAGVAALAAAGHPVITIPTVGPADLGRIFLLSEIAVAAAGWGLEINPYDQPNVQQAKDATNRVLADFEVARALPEITDADEQALRALLVPARPSATAADASPAHPVAPSRSGHAAAPAAHGPYVAIMGYLQPSAQLDAAVTELRALIRDATGLTTTFGYGPRFLHSTGQFHKGGPRVGRFLQLLHDGPEDAEIPGAPYTFTTLKNAQAIGDLSTLRMLGLPAERVTLHADDPAAAVRALSARLERLLT